MNTFERLTYGPAIAIAGIMTTASHAFAQGTLGGIDPGIAGSNDTNVRATIVRLLNVALNFLALIAVIFIIIAGIRLIVSQGEQEQKDKAKKTIIYVVVGLIVVLLAKVVVSYVTSTAIAPAA